MPGITRPDLAGCASVLHSEFTCPRQALGVRLEQFLSWGRQERGSSDRSANGEFRAMLLDVAEPGGGSLVRCHGGSATDCTAPPCWSQIVYTSRSSCDLRRCPAPDGGNPPDIPGVPPQTTACNRSPPAPPARPAGPTADREGGDLWHLPWERPGLLTEALARSERAAGWEDPSPARPLDPRSMSTSRPSAPAAPGPCPGSPPARDVRH